MTPSPGLLRVAVLVRPTPRSHPRTPRSTSAQETRPLSLNDAAGLLPARGLVNAGHARKSNRHPLDKRTEL